MAPESDHSNKRRASRTEQLDHHRLAKRMKPTFECVVCCDSIEGQAPIPINQHKSCIACFDLPGGFRSQFEAHLKSDAQKPKFGAEDIDFTACQSQFAPDFIEAYELKLAEYDVAPKQRLYCGNPECNIFLGSRRNHHGARICLCGSKTCPNCDVEVERYHKHVCIEPQPEADPFEGLIQGKHYQRCPGCTCPIELTEACNHIVCELNCGTHFCYLCGEPARKGEGHWAQGAACPLWGPADASNAHLQYEPDEMDADEMDADEMDADEMDMVDLDALMVARMFARLGLPVVPVLPLPLPPPPPPPTPDEIVNNFIEDWSAERVRLALPGDLRGDVSRLEHPPTGPEENILALFRRKDRQELYRIFYSIEVWATNRNWHMHPNMLLMSKLVRELLLVLDVYTLHQQPDPAVQEFFAAYLEAWNHQSEDRIALLTPETLAYYPTLAPIITAYQLAEDGRFEQLEDYMQTRLHLRLPGRRVLR